MRENNRNSIEKCRKKLPQFTTMNVIDGQAGLISYFSLIFYSLTIDNILNIIVLLILAGVTIATLTGENGILTRAQEAKNKTEQAQKEEKENLGDMEDILNEYATGIEVEQVTDENPGVLEGTGTSENPYTINSIEDLVVFASNVTNGTTYEGQTVKLGLSLDFNSNKSYVEPLRTDYGEYGYDGELKTLLTLENGFIPIGTQQDVINDEGTNITKNYSFNGIFNGNGKVIKNLYINTKNLTEEKIPTRIALFGFNCGTITELGLIDMNIYTNSPAFTTSGIAGQNNFTGIIQKCYTSGTIVSSSASVGGISTYSSGIITDCYNAVNIQNVIENFEMKNKICIGGISSVSSNTISNCYNIGIIDCTADTSDIKIGGIVGNGGNINNCYNLGSIRVNAEKATSLFLGGIIGHMDRTIISDCYNKGELIAKNNNHLSLGEIIGYRNLGTVTQCYYLQSDIGKGIGGGGTDDTTPVEYETDMKNILAVIGNNFKKDINNINNGYPVLKWQ